MSQIKLFIASTGKDVGKTTLSLGIMSYLSEHFPACGFMKPVGQDQLLSEGIYLDKDAFLIKHFFHLKENQALSPVSIPQGFTKDFLDGKIKKEELEKKVLKSFSDLSSYQSLVIEGTGHMGVGSIIDLSNADVASLIKAPVLLVTKGGIGSSFDELMLNLAICEKHKIPVLGVVLNKVIPEKKEMISSYFEKALRNKGIDFLGSLPFDVLLAKPTFQDLELVLGTLAMQGNDMRLKHVENMTIVASNNQVPELKPYDLVIVSASREGLIHGIIEQAYFQKIPLGFILTGSTSASDWILKEIAKTSHFVLTVQKNSQDVLIELSNYHAKIQKEDSEKIKEAIMLVKKHLNFKKLIEKLTKKTKEFI